MQRINLQRIMELELKVKKDDGLYYVYSKVFSEKETLQEAIQEIKENGFCFDKDKNKYFFQELLYYYQVEFNIVDLPYLEIHEEVKTNDVKDTFIEYIGHIKLKHDVIKQDYLELKDKTNCKENQFFNYVICDCLKENTKKLIQAIKSTEYKSKRMFYIIDNNEHKLFNVITQQIGFYKQTKNIAKDYIEYLNNNKAILLTLKEKL